MREYNFLLSKICPSCFQLQPGQIGWVPHPISTIYSAASAWTAYGFNSSTVPDCPQIIFLVLPSGSTLLAWADKDPPKWPQGHNLTTEVNGRNRPLCLSKCNFRRSPPQRYHFPGSGKLWNNLGNIKRERGRQLRQLWGLPLLLAFISNTLSKHSQGWNVFAELHLPIVRQW